MSIFSFVDWPSFSLGTVATLVVTGSGFMVRRVAISRSKLKAKKRTMRQKPIDVDVNPHSSTPVAQSGMMLDAPSRLDFEMDRDGRWRGALTAPLLLFLLLGIIAVLFFFLRSRENTVGGPTPREPAEHTPSIVIILQQNMDKGLDEARFTVERHGNAEVVRGSRGSYYRIDLKDAEARRLVFFQAGKYLKDEFGEEFRTALAAFRNDVTAVLERGKVPYNIYVRGSADIVANSVPVIGELVDGKERTVYYYPTAGYDTNQFLPRTREKIISLQFANRDLPFLRAAYMQDRLADVGFKSTVLQGGVTDRENDSDRNATMLLFVNWPSGDHLTTEQER
jgi:hypothetical protein